MIIPLSQLYESVDRTRIYFVILDPQICLPPERVVGSIWNSTQLGTWASKGQVIVVQNPQFIPGIDTTRAEVVAFHQAYLVKPDLNGLILHQRKSHSGFLINTLEDPSFSLIVRTRDAICLSEDAPLDQTAARLMEGKTTLQQLTAWRAGETVVGPGEEGTQETGLIELVMLPRGVLFQFVKRHPVMGGLKG